MNSDRHLVQLYIEEKIGCNDASMLSSLVAPFEAFTIGHQDFTLLNDAIQRDSNSLFKKGVQSIVQAISALDSGQESWALIKLYYSCYYLLRSDLAKINVSIVRCKNIYTLDVGIGNSPKKRNGPRYRGDHLATIALFEEYYSGVDVILSQTIDGKIGYDWLRDRREWINYRRREFIDGEGCVGLNENDLSYVDQIQTYCQDTIPIYCFDKDFAALALPVKRLQLSAVSRGQAGIDMIEEAVEFYRRSGINVKSCLKLLECIKI